jgi:hypothetical protein
MPHQSMELKMPWLEGEYSHRVRYATSPPAIQKQQWHLREAQIELPDSLSGSE